MKISELLRDEICRIRAKGEVINYSHILHKIIERKFDAHYVSDIPSVLNMKIRLHKIINQK